MKPDIKDLAIDLKCHFFELIDQLNELKENQDLSVDKRAISVAITQLETAQMWAVRSLHTNQEIRSYS